MSTRAATPHQGRARTLYDEQLQRQHQEKALFRAARAEPLVAPSSSERTMTMTDESARGKPAAFDPSDGTVRGSGSGAGGGTGVEDHDDDAKGGGGGLPTGDGSHHPLPASAEARHDEIPEQVERDKGIGDEGRAAVQPRGPAVDPDGSSYDSEGDGR